MKKLLYIFIPIDIILVLSSIFFAYRQMATMLSVSLDSDVIGYSLGQEFLFFKIPFVSGMQIQLSSYSIYIMTILCIGFTVWLKFKIVKSRK